MTEQSYPDDRCPIWWGDRQCTDDAGHPERDGGGHHQFDLTDVGIKTPVLVALDDEALTERTTDGHPVKILRNMHLRSVSLITLPDEPWPGWAIHTTEEDDRAQDS
jgi:hypothetical protein